jgi:hypothetical protein
MAAEVATKRRQINALQIHWTARWIWRLVAPPLCLVGLEVDGELGRFGFGLSRHGAGMYSGAGNCALHEPPFARGVVTSRTRVAATSSQGKIGLLHPHPGPLASAFYLLRSRDCQSGGKLRAARQTMWRGFGGQRTSVPAALCLHHTAVGLQQVQPRIAWSAIDQTDAVAALVAMMWPAFQSGGKAVKARSAGGSLNRRVMRQLWTAQMQLDFWCLYVLQASEVLCGGTGESGA